MIKTWRAHCQHINAIEYIETAKVLITGSVDCTIRLWTPTGLYIGTLGQEETWNLYDPKTYKHPRVPYDVLVHYNSIPDHPLINKVETMEEVLKANKLIDNKENETEVYYIFFHIIYDIR